MIKLQVIVPIVGLLATLLYIIFFIPPTNDLTVFITILLITAIGWLVGMLTKRKKIIFLLPLTILIFFSMNYLAGFQIINTILLVSFIIGLSLLL